MRSAKGKKTAYLKVITDLLWSTDCGKQDFKNLKLELGPVADAYNPSYLGG
jgi:hypothetical protein